MSEQQTWNTGVVKKDATLRAVAENLNVSSLKIVLVVDDDGSLIGTITDGDIRRNLLSAKSFETTAGEVMTRNPLVVPKDVSKETVLQLMHANKIQQIPIVDSNNLLVGLHQWDDFEKPLIRDCPVVLMAGGKGIRLRPMTENCPKPMLEVSGRPILEHILRKVSAEGFSKFFISINYMGHVIEEYFGDGQNYGVDIQYLKEDDILGTAGALSLLPELASENFLVLNGDVISDVNCAALLDFHNNHQAMATMAVKVHDWELPYGVVEVEGLNISGFQEKPTIRSLVNAGVYALSTHSLKWLEYNRRKDMPELFDDLNSANQKTVAYLVHEHWLDVGRPADLSKANQKR